MKQLLRRLRNDLKQKCVKFDLHFSEVKSSELITKKFMDIMSISPSNSVYVFPFQVSVTKQICL